MILTIGKAIKNLKAGRKDAGMIPPEEYTATIDLSTAALNAIREARKHHGQLESYLLPGETEE